MNGQTLIQIKCFAAFFKVKVVENNLPTNHNLLKAFVSKNCAGKHLYFCLFLFSIIYICKIFEREKY